MRAAGTPRPVGRGGTGRPPPGCNTGVTITSHCLRATYEQSESEVLELVNDLTDGGYRESHRRGGFGYRSHHEFEHGLKVYVEPGADNMPPVLVDVPGQACEALGHEKLQILACNGKLTRVDVAFDGAPFTLREMREWVKQGDVRTKAKKGKFWEDIWGNPDGETLYLGSRSSERYLRAYDRRGDVRLELELKGDMAEAFKPVLLSPPEDFPRLSVGVLRDYVDFVHREATSNVSRAPLLDAWEAFTQALEKVKIRMRGVVVDTLERPREWLYRQVAPTLAMCQQAGMSVEELIRNGERRMRRRHRRLVAMAS